MEKENKNTKYLADSVLHRIVQIVQEGFLLGIDVADLMRQIKLVEDSQNSQMLILDPDYVALVEEMHQKYVSEAEARQTASAIANLNSQTTVFS